MMFDEESVDPVKRQIVAELFRKSFKRFKTRSYRQKGIFDTLSIDLADMSLYTDENDNIRYLLVVIDIFTKKLFVRTLKTKSMSEVSSNMESILKDIKHQVTNIISDNGSEFKNSQFKKVMTKYKINHYFTYSPMKACHAERVIRTIKMRIMKMQTLFGTFRYTDFLQKIVNDYNNTVHSKTKMTPNSIDKNHEKILLNSVYKKDNDTNTIKKRKYKKGMFVRISRLKHVFEKGHTTNWSVEIFEIYKVQSTSPPSYILKDYNGHIIEGSFYEQVVFYTFTNKTCLCMFICVYLCLYFYVSFLFLFLL